MHGNHLLRPKRSLKISAASMKNFPVEFSQDLCAESSATSLCLILCNALVADSKDIPSVVTGGNEVVAATGAGIVDKIKNGYLHLKDGYLYLKAVTGIRDKMLCTSLLPREGTI
jgi:hypothetical protein